MTFGTFPYLLQIANRHPDENVTLLQNETSTLLLHETKGPSIFNEPILYTVLKENGPIQNDSSFVGFHYFSISDEARPLFEFESKHHLFKQNPLLTAFRILRPKLTNLYLIITVWKKEDDYEQWINRNPFKEIKQTMTRKKLFSDSYISKTYYIVDSFSHEIE